MVYTCVYDNISIFQVAVTTKNEVYQWGSNPHGLRHFVHSQRRARQGGRPAFDQADRHLRPLRVDTTFVNGTIRQVYQPDNLCEKKKRVKFI